MILIPIFLTLFAGWMLWGWVVGESKNIRWLRHWCAPIFVGTVVLMAVGAGALSTAVVINRQMTADVGRLLDTISEQIRDGHADEVVREIESVRALDDPDAEPVNLLTQLPTITQHLRGETVPEAVARTEDGITRQ
ncbi:MAG: hypothetical protein R3C49_05805 [Planctomycetaceae bacterium]